MAKESTVTPVGPAQFVTLDQPKTMKGFESNPPKYSMKLLLKETEKNVAWAKGFLKNLEDLWLEAYGDKTAGADNSLVLEDFKEFLDDKNCPIHVPQGRRHKRSLSEKKTPEGYFEMRFSANENYPPIVATRIDGEVVRLESPEEIRNHVYSGAIVRVAFNPYTWGSGANKGFSFSLNKVQKELDGERIAGGVTDVEMEEIEIDESEI